MTAWDAKIWHSEYVSSSSFRGSIIPTQERSSIGVAITGIPLLLNLANIPGPVSRNHLPIGVFISPSDTVAALLYAQYVLRTHNLLVQCCLSIPYLVLVSRRARRISLRLVSALSAGTITVFDVNFRIQIFDRRQDVVRG